MLKHFITRLFFACLSALPLAGAAKLETFEALVDEGNRLQHAGKYSPAEEKYRGAIRLGDENWLAPVYLARVWTNLGSVLYQEARLAESEECYRKAGDYWRESAGEEKEEGIAILLNNLGALHRAQGRYAEAEKVYMQAIAIRKRQGLDGSAPGATLWCNLAEVLRRQKKLEEAREAVDRGRILGTRLMVHDSQPFASMLHISGDVYGDLKRFAEAEAFHVEALKIRSKVFGADHPLVAVSKNNLASLYREQEKLDRVVPLLEDALRIWRATFGEDHPSVGFAYTNLGQAYVSLDRSIEAEPLYRKGIAITEKRLGQDHPEVASAYRNLGDLFHRQGKLQGAEKIYWHAVAILERSLGSDHLQTAQLLKNVVAVLSDQKRFQEAEKVQKRVMQILEARSGKRNEEYLSQAELFAQLAKRNGRRDSTVTALWPRRQIPPAQ
jgi:tetratricopeptide (TPR) repeat protein